MYPVAYFTKEANPRLAKRPLIFDEYSANRGLISLRKREHRQQAKC